MKRKLRGGSSMSAERGRGGGVAPRALPASPGPAARSAAQTAPPSGDAVFPPAGTDPGEASFTSGAVD